MVSLDLAVQPQASVPQIVVAVVESIAFLVTINCQLLQQASPAGIYQLPVARLGDSEATLLGAVRIAHRLAIPPVGKVDTEFKPQDNPSLRHRFNFFKRYLGDHCGGIC